MLRLIWVVTLTTVVITALGCGQGRPQPKAEVDVGTPNQAEQRKPHQLILGKWEGINSQGSPIGMEFSDKGVVKICTRVTAKNGEKTVDKGPFRVTATYKFVDDDTLETELAFGKVQTNQSKVVVTQDELTITATNKEPQKYKRVQEFSSELMKAAPEKSKTEGGE